MRIEIEPTADVVMVNGTLCRRWEGRTVDGRTPVVLFVATLRVLEEHEARFQAEARESVFETDAPVGDVRR